MNFDCDHRNSVWSNQFAAAVSDVLLCMYLCESPESGREPAISHRRAQCNPLCDASALVCEAMIGNQPIAHTEVTSAASSPLLPEKKLF